MNQRVIGHNMFACPRCGKATLPIITELCTDCFKEFCGEFIDDLEKDDSKGVV